MTRAFFREELETVATWWRIWRTDGIALAFTTHDRDLWFDGLLHRSAPGLLPSSVRLTNTLADDGLDVEGALSHDTIREDDIEAGRFDEAAIAIGVVDWFSCESAVLYTGNIGSISRDAGRFASEIKSAKAALDIDPVPRSSPTCRAPFCGPGCNLPPARFEYETIVSEIDSDRNAVRIPLSEPDRFRFGTLRWVEGPYAGLLVQVSDVIERWLLLDVAIAGDALGCPVILREGCDHELSTCDKRFGNAVNFRGEPFLPGNDFLSQNPAVQ